jgi:hypothetical protein
VKAGRLAHNGINIVEGNDVGGQTHDGDQRTKSSLDTHSTSKVPVVGRHQGSDFTGSDPSPAEPSRGRKRRKRNKDGSLSFIFQGLPQAKADPTQPGPTALEKQQGNNVGQRGGIRKQDQTYMASGKSDLGPSTNVATVLQAEAPRPRSSTAIKRPRTRRGVRPIVKQSQGILAQRIDFVVISDTERESSGEVNE